MILFLVAPQTPKPDVAAQDTVMVALPELL